MKANDFISIFEYVDKMKKMPPNEEKKMPRRRAPRHMKHMKDTDIVSELQKKLNEADMLKQVLEDRHNAHKKEEKKDDKKKGGPSLEQVMIMLVGSYPIIGLLIYYFAR